jgi:hypothetical protein
MGSANLDYSAGSWAADLKAPDGNDVPTGGHWLLVSNTYGHDVLLLHNANMALLLPAK